MNFSGIKVGDKAESILRGWGEVSVVRDDSFAVDFGEHRNWDWFRNDGKKRKSDATSEIVNWKREKGEPTGGNHVLSGCGRIYFAADLHEDYIQNGRSFKTHKQAEVAWKLFNTYQRQLAWIFDNYPEYNPFNEKYDFAVNCDILGRWFAVFVPIMHGNELRMPEHIARELTEKLNSGEVKL